MRVKIYHAYRFTGTIDGLLDYLKALKIKYNQCVKEEIGGLFFGCKSKFYEIVEFIDLASNKESRLFNPRCFSNGILFC